MHLKVLLLTVVIGLSPFLINSASAQMHLVSPREQWQNAHNISQITCQEGLVLLTKANGMPACVSTSSYLRLVDRGWGMWDDSVMMNRPQMMNDLMETMMQEPQLMQHWHGMILKNPQQMQDTRNDWIQQLKDNPQLMANMMGPITTDPDLQKQMIDHMTQHMPMMQSIRNDSDWMDMMDDQMIGHGMMGSMGMHRCAWCPTTNNTYVHYGTATCTWCPVTNQTMQTGWMMHNPQNIEDMMHHMWINSGIRQQMFDHMLEHPYHMGSMMNQMMDSMMDPMMDDPELRQQMLDMFAQNQDFMQKLRDNQNFQQDLNP